MTKFYFVPGLGCDRRIFQNCMPLLDIPAEQVHYLEWLRPISLNETIRDYALRIGQDIPKDGDTVIVGLSLGGMVATELSRIVPNKKLFIISSIKHESERPFVLNMAKRVPIYHFMLSWVTREFAPRFARWLGITERASSFLFADMLKQMPPNHLRWARHAAL